MNIRPKIIAWIAALFLILGVAAVLVERQIIMPSFAALERADAGTAMRRIDHAFTLNLEQLGVLAIDWGNWGIVYRFMQDHERNALEADINLSNMREVGANLMLIVDAGGNVIHSLTADLPPGGTLELAELASLPADFPWRAQLRSRLPAQGLMPTRLGPIMIAEGPILDGKGNGPSRGMMIVGRLLTSAEIARIAAIAQAKLTMLPAPAQPQPDRLTQTGSLTHIDKDLLDIYGNPILTLRVDVPRDITAYGNRAVNFASASLFAAAIIIVILLIVIVSRVVLNPLAVVTRHAVTVGQDKDLTARLGLERHDEIGVLAREFDRMVERVAESRARLVDESFEAGFAELARGLLHNLGNALTPVGVRLDKLARRLRGAPALDAVHAASELKDGVEDPQRRADLEEFLHLACEEIAAALRDVDEDIQAMNRQTVALQSMLGEQMRSARNVYVVEAVRLPDLVAQALEIVPDGHRQRLDLRLDDSLRRIGVVRVPRTVLRLVLQNLVINAAESVRDAGREHGVLRLSATLEQHAECEALHVVCADDGAGIAPENIGRIFEQGFSTKSHETNHGIGLHWCANSIAALGGRMWAESAGDGRGAAIHFLVPTRQAETVPLAGAAAA